MSTDNQKSGLALGSEGGSNPPLDPEEILDDQEVSETAKSPSVGETAKKVEEKKRQGSERERWSLGTHIKEYDGLLTVVFLAITLLYTIDSDRRTDLSDRFLNSNAKLDAILDATYNLTSPVSEENRVTRNGMLLGTLRHRVASGLRSLDQVDKCASKVVEHVDRLSRGWEIVYNKDQQPLPRDDLIYSLVGELKLKMGKWRDGKSQPFVGYFRDNSIFELDKNGEAKCFD